MVSVIFSLIGSAGSILLALAFLPQCYRILNTRHTKDISLYYLAILVTGSFCFVVYGYAIGDPIVFILNAYATMANFELVLLKLYFDKNSVAQQITA
jgi:MtN3 and saliva related transmembrane protein